MDEDRSFGPALTVCVCFLCCTRHFPLFFHPASPTWRIHLSTCFNPPFLIV